MIIISLPYRGPQSLRPAASEYWMEYRLDFCEDLDSIDFSAFNDRCILTYKGQGNHPDLLSKMLASSALVDIDTDESPNLDYHEYADKLILSLHLPKFSQDRIQKLIDLPLKCFAKKVVFEAHSFEEILQTKDMIMMNPPPKIIFNVTGPLAAFQRSLYRIFASDGVYLYDKESTYPGQLSLRLFELINANAMDSESIVYGIIGGKQVNDSYSLWVYNEYFKEIKQHAHYLPIPARSAQEVIMALKYLKEHFRIKGFSITSPFKSSLPHTLGFGTKAMNSIRFSAIARDEYHYIRELDLYANCINTDLIALRTCLSRLDITPADAIYIYGSGACAEAFIAFLKETGHHNIYLGGRNLERCKALAEQYDLEQKAPASCDLLINASSRLYFNSWSELPGFRMAIELPYKREVSSDLQKFTQESNLPFISGRDFFELQHQAQRDFLLGAEQE